MLLFAGILESRFRAFRHSFCSGSTGLLMYESHSRHRGTSENRYRSFSDNRRSPGYGPTETHVLQLKDEYCGYLPAYGEEWLSVQVNIWLCLFRRYFEGHTVSGADRRRLYGSCTSSGLDLGEIAPLRRLRVVAESRLYSRTVSFAEAYRKQRVSKWSRWLDQPTV